MHQIIGFEIKGDEKGNLIALEENKNIPFSIKRVYYIFNTNSNVRRGFHAHKNLKQVFESILFITTPSKRSELSGFSL